MRFQKLMWHNMMRSTKNQKVLVLHYSINWLSLRGALIAGIEMEEHRRRLEENISINIQNKSINSKR